jgi:hypothetical protein
VLVLNYIPQVQLPNRAETGAGHGQNLQRKDAWAMPKVTLASKAEELILVYLASSPICFVKL